MSRYLLTCTPAHGHVLPLLQVARHLVAGGHDVVFLTSRRYEERVTAAGALFRPLPAEADVDLDDANGAFPEREGLTGAAALRFDMSTLFIRPGRAQLEAVRVELARNRIDAVLTEPLFVGAALLQRLPKTERPPVVVLGIFPLGARSVDTAPFGLGVTPMGGPLGRMRSSFLRLVAERVIFGGVQKEADAMAREAVGRDLGGFVLDWAGRADAYVQFSVSAFEYPRSDLPASVHFAGPLPSGPSTAPLPEWWSDLDGRRSVIHVSQGTIANADFGQLVLPTIAGLAQADVLVVVSTGGRPREVLPKELPANVRVAEYLPYDRLLPEVDVFVTNGGFGGVQQALAQGVPLVVAGQTEDKVEVSARVGWTGVGINLRTNAPKPGQVAEAVHRVLAEPTFRNRARQVGEAMRAADAWQTLDAVLAGMSASGRAANRPVTR